MFHDFAYRLQESVPNNSASNEFVRKRALSFFIWYSKKNDLDYRDPSFYKPFTFSVHSLRFPHYQKQPPQEQPFQLLVDIPQKMASGKSFGYKKWATKFNLKEMSKTLLLLQEQKIGSAEELRERTAAATERYHTMGDSIKAAEARLTQIAVLKTHIINYAKTRPAYDAYRKSGYSKKFLEAHREEITLHKAAKAAFDEAGMKKLPKVKELDAEFAELLTKKKASYPDYRKARNEMQELVRAQKNVERFFADEKDTTEKTQTR